MNVVILGAGVVGATTAYFLAKRGCKVTVIDSATEVANGASRANGAQLSYSFVESFAQPSRLGELPTLLRGRNDASKMRISGSLLPWGLRYLANCAPSRARKNTHALLRLAAHSAQLMAEIKPIVARKLPIQESGKLVLLNGQHDICAAEAMIETKRSHGFDARLVSASEAVEIEPALSVFDMPIVAAIYSRHDQVADSHEFVVCLKTFLERQGDVEFRLGSTAEKLITRRGQIAAVECKDIVSADAAVVCLGAWSGQLLRKIGIRLPIYPVRGYSLTLPYGNASPSVSVTSLEHGIVFSKLNGHVRIAGFADFFGFRTSADLSRIAALTATARRVAPQAADYDVSDHQPWAGFRPMTPSGVPLVGPTKIKGLHLNTGHGMFGWTLACATAELAAQGLCDSLSA